MKTNTPTTTVLFGRLFTRPFRRLLSTLATPLAITLPALLLVAAYIASVDAKEPRHKKTAPDIATLLAEKNFKQGDIARGIRVHNIDTWRYLDKHHIFIDGVGKRNNYLIRFSHSCSSIRGSTLVYKTRTGQLTKFDSIGVADHFHTGHSINTTRHCLIDEIFTLEQLDESGEEQTTQAASHS